MKFIILQENPQYYKLVLPYFYQEWYDIYENLEIYTLKDLQLYYENNNNAQTFIIINNANKFIASYTLFTNISQIFLGDVYVVPIHRNKTIGKNIIINAINKASKTNNNYLYIYSYDKTIEFYKNQGFVIEKKYNDGKYLMKYYLRHTDRIMLINILYFIFLIIILYLLIL
jgi:predicted GNAT family N-acyltransferase